MSGFKAIIQIVKSNYLKNNEIAPLLYMVFFALWCPLTIEEALINTICSLVYQTFYSSDSEIN